MSDDVEAIVRALTPAQRDVVVTGYGAISDVVSVALIEPSLADEIRKDGELGSLHLFTRIGLAVRQSLLSSPVKE